MIRSGKPATGIVSVAVMLFLMAGMYEVLVAAANGSGNNNVAGLAAEAPTTVVSGPGAASSPKADVEPNPSSRPPGLESRTEPGGPTATPASCTADSGRTATELVTLLARAGLPVVAGDPRSGPPLPLGACTEAQFQDRRGGAGAVYIYTNDFFARYYSSAVLSQGGRLVRWLDITVGLDPALVPRSDEYENALQTMIPRPPPQG